MNKDKPKNNRLIKIIKNAFSSGASKGITILVTFITIPLTIDYLGTEKYGLWMAITSLIALMQMMDLGVGNALISLIADKKNKDGIYETFDIILSGLCTITMIGVFIVVTSFLVIPYVNWQWLLNFQDPNLIPIAENSIKAFVIIFSLSIITGVAQSIRLGFQDGHINGGYNSIGQILNLIFIYITIKLDFGLTILIISSSLGTIFCNIGNLIFLIKKILGRREYYSNIGKIYKYSKNILKSGSGFFILQIMSIISYNLDNFIVSHFSGMDNVATFSVTMKLFSLTSVILTLFFSGMWAAYADAKSNGDWNWINKLYKRSLVVSSFAAFIISAVIAVTLPYTISLLSKGTIKPENSLILGMFLWGGGSAVIGATSCLLNGIHYLKAQIIVAIITTILNIILSITLTKSIGLSGPIWGSFISILLVYPFLIIYSLKLINKFRES
ncbi:lipopolysaccharide biosynthesis protein [Photobacterium leiognathi]|uniref:lipopolysaccharide biosynthesis protein n=1 Tax=Photobacterium leiognathi TaxID=553611 RepID=UPI002981AB33|nr:oligosaccharide flippase family protein [Photobacterium leiognathi]